VAVCCLLCLFDGFLIVSAFDIVSIRKVAVVANGVDASVALLAPPDAPIFGGLP
jgi:hypothetical protein